MSEGAASDSPRPSRSAGRPLGGRWMIVILIVVVILAFIVVGAARPAPVFSLGSLSSHRSCFFNTTRGNYSYWNVSFTIGNTGPSASAAVAISIDGATVSFDHEYVASGSMATVIRTVTDSAVPVDPGCEPHNVTAAIWGYLL